MSPFYKKAEKQMVYKLYVIRRFGILLYGLLYYYSYNFIPKGKNS